MKAKIINFLKVNKMLIYCPSPTTTRGLTLQFAHQLIVVGQSLITSINKEALWSSFNQPCDQAHPVVSSCKSLVRLRATSSSSLVYSKLQQVSLC